MNKPLVWQLLDSRDIGGIESHCATLKETMDPIADVQIRLLCEYGPHPSLSAYGAKALSPGLIRAYLDEKPVAIHTHGYKATLLARTLLRPFGARLCTTYHAGETLKGKMALYGWLQKHTGFLSDDTSPVLSLNQDAKVWVTGWDEGAGYRNSIMVVQYEDGAFDGLTKGDIDTNGRGTISMNELNRVDGVQADWLFPNFSMQGKGGQLLPGATLDLNEGAPIAAGTNITFGLAANAWRGNSINRQNIGGNGSNYWGLDFLNPEASASADINSREDNSRHVAMLFADDSQNTVLMGFEDLRRPWGDNDFNDAVFSIYATPEGAFAGSEIATAPAPGLAVLGLLGLAFFPRVRKKA